MAVILVDLLSYLGVHDIKIFSFLTFSYDSYTYEMYVKTELRRMITDFFPDEFVGNNLARNQCRDRVLQCVACAARVGVIETEAFDTG